MTLDVLENIGCTRSVLWSIKDKCLVTAIHYRKDKRDGVMYVHYIIDRNELNRWTLDLIQNTTNFLYCEPVSNFRFEERDVVEEIKEKYSMSNRDILILDIEFCKRYKAEMPDED